MPYVPNNGQIFASAFAGALSAFGVRPNGPIDQPDYVKQAEASLAMAEAIDTAWGANPNNAMDFVAVGVSAGLLMRSSNLFPNISAYNSAANWAKAAEAIVAAIKSGDIVATDAGITFPDLGGGGSGITQLTGDVEAGPGTGSVPAFVSRISGAGGAGTAFLGANIRPTIDNGWFIGDTAERIARFVGVTFQAVQTNTDTVPTVQMDADHGLLFGPGGASPFDTILSRPSPSTLNLTDVMGGFSAFLQSGFFEVDAYVLAPGVGYFGPGVGGLFLVGGFIKTFAGVQTRLGDLLMGNEDVPSPLTFGSVAVPLGGGGITTLANTEYSRPIIQVTDAGLTSDATVVLPATTTWYLFDASGVTFDGFQLIIQGGTGSLTATVTTPVTFWVYINGNNAYIPGGTGTSGVTAVGGAAPIVSSGGLTPTISIVPATDSVPGSMSAADKTKLDGIGTIVTSVGATSPIHSSGGTTPTITIAGATDLAAGSMSAADKTKLDEMVPNVFIYQPGGTNAGNRFTNILDIMNLVTDGYLVIVDSSVGTAIFPNGAGSDLKTGTWQGKTGGETLQFDNNFLGTWTNVVFRNFGEILFNGLSGPNLTPNATLIGEVKLQFEDIWQGGLINVAGGAAIGFSAPEAMSVTCRNVTATHTSLPIFDAGGHGMSLFLFDNSPFPNAALTTTAGGNVIYDASSKPTNGFIQTNWTAQIVDSDVGLTAGTLAVGYGTTTNLDSNTRTLYIGGAAGTGAAVVNFPAVGGFIKPGWTITLEDAGRSALGFGVTVNAPISIEDPNNIGLVGSSVQLYNTGFSITWEYTGTYWKVRSMVNGPIVDTLTTTDTAPHTIFSVPLAVGQTISWKIRFTTHDATTISGSGGGEFYGTAYNAGGGTGVVVPSASEIQQVITNVPFMVWRAPNGPNFQIQYATNTSAVTIQALSSTTDQIRWVFKLDLQYSTL